jgi:hypothetical protein
VAATACGTLYGFGVPQRSCFLAFIFVQRFGGSINVHLHFHCVFLEGVFVDRTAQGLTPRFLPADPPTDADIATVLQRISRRVIRALRKLGYLEADSQEVVPTGDDPLASDDPELARTLVASVQQRIAFGERAGQQVWRIGSGFGDAGERPTLTGTRCASVNGFSLHANTHVPAHRRDQLERLLRYTARGAVSLKRLTVNTDGDLLYTFTHPWSDGTTDIKLSPIRLLQGGLEQPQRLGAQHGVTARGHGSLADATSDAAARGRKRAVFFLSASGVTCCSFLTSSPIRIPQTIHWSPVRRTCGFTPGCRWRLPTATDPERSASSTTAPDT